MKLKNTLRTLIGIRKQRKIPKPGDMPIVGSNIVLEQLRIRLTHPINHEEWAWFTKKGWRAEDMRTNRRVYSLVADEIVAAMLLAEKVERETIHQTLMDRDKTARTSRNKSKEAVEI
jgi:hypothetical protein